MADWYKADFLNELKRRGRIPIEHLPDSFVEGGWYSYKSGPHTIAVYNGECIEGEEWEIFIRLSYYGDPYCAGNNPPTEAVNCISYDRIVNGYNPNYPYGEDGPIPEDCARQAIDLLYSYAPPLIELLFPRLHGNFTPRITCFADEMETDKLKCVIPRLAAILNLLR